jgi:hypothetical protein
MGLRRKIGEWLIGDQLERLMLNHGLTTEKPLPELSTIEELSEFVRRRVDLPRHGQIVVEQALRQAMAIGREEGHKQRRSGDL